MLCKPSPSLLALLALSITGTCATVRANDAPKKAPVRVALYDDAGTGPKVVEVVEALQGSTDVTVQRIKAAEIRDGRLKDFDVVIFPGGSGGGEGRALGEEGREKVRSFIRGGGGYVGICAGAYLATCDYPWSLNILDARVIDKTHWARGNGDVEVSLTLAARALLGLEGEKQTIPYYQGPLLAPAGNPEVEDYEPLSEFRSEIAKKGAPTGVMIGTTAIARGRFGQGRVLCFSPHPEKAPALYGALQRGVKWAGGAP